MSMYCIVFSRISRVQSVGPYALPALLMRGGAFNRHAGCPFLRRPKQKARRGGLFEATAPYLAGVGVAEASAACLGAGVGIAGAVGVATGAAGALTAAGSAMGAVGAGAPPLWNFTTSGTM